MGRVDILEKHHKYVLPIISVVNQVYFHQGKLNLSGYFSGQTTFVEFINYNGNMEPVTTFLTIKRRGLPKGVNSKKWHDECNCSAHVMYSSQDLVMACGILIVLKLICSTLESNLSLQLTATVLCSISALNHDCKFSSALIPTLQRCGGPRVGSWRLWKSSSYSFQKVRLQKKQSRKPKSQQWTRSKQTSPTIDSYGLYILNKSERKNILWSVSLILWSFSLSPPLSFGVNGTLRLIYAEQKRATKAAFVFDLGAYSAWTAHKIF